MKIKGNFLKDYAQTVRDTPELDWGRFLRPEDFEVVKSIIIPTQWYPAEVMGRIGRGLFEMRINKNYELLRIHGQSRFTQFFDIETQKFLTKRDPVAAVTAYLFIAKRYIDELSIKLDQAGPGRAEVSFAPVEIIPSWDLFRVIQAGTMEKIIEVNGGKSPHHTFRSEEREGHTADICQLAWS